MCVYIYIYYWYFSAVYDVIRLGSIGGALGDRLKYVVLLIEPYAVMGNEAC